MSRMAWVDMVTNLDTLKPSSSAHCTQSSAIGRGTETVWTAAFLRDITGHYHSE